MIKSIKKVTVCILCFVLMGVSVVMGISNLSSIGLAEGDNTVKTIDLKDSKYVHKIGRTYYDETKQATYFNFSASGFEVKFYGTSLTADFVGTNLNNVESRPYITVMVDKDTDPDRALILPIKKEGSLVIAEGLIEGYHTIRVYKRSESTSSFLGVKSVTTDGRMVPVEKEEYALNIEFYGDSITCGHGVDGKIFDEEFNTRDENAFHTYAYTATRALNAKASFISAGGFPLYQSLFALKAPINNIPDLIDKSAVTWDENFVNPTYAARDNKKDIVVINLGANDSSIADFITGHIWKGHSGEDIIMMIANMNDRLMQQSADYMSAFWQLSNDNREEVLVNVRASKVYQDFISGFKNKYTTFVETLADYYPGVKIICSSGMIEMNSDLNVAVNEVAEAYDYTYRLKHNSLSVGGIMPGKGHPNRKMHDFAGNELTTLIKEIMK